MGRLPVFCCVAILNRFFSKCCSKGRWGTPVWALKGRWGTPFFGLQIRWGVPFMIDFWTQVVVHLAAFRTTWLLFLFQLGFQNWSKSKKNRCQDAFHLGLRFLIDFWSVWAVNLDPFVPKKPNFSLGKPLFFENTPFEVHIDF